MYRSTPRTFRSHGQRRVSSPVRGLTQMSYTHSSPSTMGSTHARMSSRPAASHRCTSASVAQVVNASCRLRQHCPHCRHLKRVLVMASPGDRWIVHFLSVQGKAGSGPRALCGRKLQYRRRSEPHLQCDESIPRDVQIHSPLRQPFLGDITLPKSAKIAVPVALTRTFSPTVATALCGSPRECETYQPPYMRPVSAASPLLAQSCKEAEDEDP